MNNSLLDAFNQNEADKALADALGITVDELGELDYGDVETVSGNRYLSKLGYLYYFRVYEPIRSL
jgi:hypothetical protein